MKDIKTMIVSKYYVCENFTRKYSPEILAGAGVTAIVAGTVLACKGTLKALDVMEEHKASINIIGDTLASHPHKYTEEDALKDKTMLTTQTTVKMIKAYMPAVGVTALGIGCMMGSNHILRKRNIGLAAAYATIDKSFKEYRKRVSDRFGDEVELQIRHNMKPEEVTETKIDENGNEVVETKIIMKADPNGYSDYARFFDESNPNWKNNAEFNKTFLISVQNWANSKLIASGRLFLNEVYDALGMEHTKAGQVVGWTHNPDGENEHGDNYVDFGIFNADSERARAFVNEYEKNILLDFNVDGNVWELM